MNCFFLCFCIFLSAVLFPFFSEVLPFQLLQLFSDKTAVFVKITELLTTFSDIQFSTLTKLILQQPTIRIKKVFRFVFGIHESPGSHFPAASDIIALSIVVKPFIFERFIRSQKEIPAITFFYPVSGKIASRFCLFRKQKDAHHTKPKQYRNAALPVILHPFSSLLYSIHKTFARNFHKF